MHHLKYKNKTYVCCAPRMAHTGMYTCDAWNMKTGIVIKGVVILNTLADLLVKGHGLKKDCATTDCRLCVNFNKCELELNRTETLNLEKSELTDEEVLAKAAEISARVVQAEAVKSVEKIRGTWFECFSRMTEEERWAEYARYHEPSLHDKTPIPAGNGLPGGGGSNNKAKKNPKGNKVFTDVWDSV